MSRSFKKSHVCKQKNSKFAKKQAKRKVRRLNNEQLQNGNAYKKYYSRYDIWDWGDIVNTFEQFKKFYSEFYEDYTDQELRNEYEKRYLRK